MLRIAIISFFSFCFMVPFAQTGPGGIGSASNLIFWYDADRLGLSNNDNVNNLSDFSGNANDMASSDGPTYKINQVNSKPALNFNGTSEELSINSVNALNSDGTLSWFTVFNSTSNDGSVIGSRYSNANMAWGTRRYNASSFYSRAVSAGLSVAGNSYTQVAGFNVHSCIWNNGSGTLDVYLNSTHQFQSTNAFGVPANHVRSTIGKNVHNSSGRFQGDLAELITFSSVLNSTQRIIVDNYLAAKYNLTIANDKFAHQAAHGNEVAGIGRESISDLHTDAQGTSIVRINGADDLEDGEYMLWGHNGAGTGNNTTEVPASYTVGTSQRLDQEWRVDISGGDNSVGTVDISFDLTGISFGADPDEFRILIDADGNFTNATVDPTIPTIAGSVISFANITFADGDFFTIGNSNQVNDCASLTSSNWQTVIWDCGSAPDSGSNVIISDGTAVTIIAGSTESANNLTLHGGGSGTLVVAANATLIVKADLDIQNGATLTFADGATLILRGVNGNGTQTITNNSGSTINFNNLNINNTNDVVLTGVDGYELTNGLTLVHGNLTNNNTFTFLSDLTSTAYVNPVPNGSILNGTGTYVVERFREGRAANWGNIGTSGVETDIEDLNGEVLISGIPGGNGFATAQGGGAFVSMYYWDPITDQYIVPTNTSEAFEIGRGYEMWLATTNTTWDPQAWSLSGDINLDPTSIAVIGGGGGNNWNLIANPYPGVLDWDNITSNYPGIVNGDYWYVDADLNAYASVSAGGGATVPSGQGIWIQTGGFLSLDLDPSIDLVANNNSSSSLKRRVDDQLMIHLENLSEEFGAAVYLRKDFMAYEGLDERDITPIRLPDPRACNLSIAVGGKDLMVNYVNTDVDRIELPLTMETGLTGDYSLNVKGLNYFSEYQCASIRNEATGDQIYLDEEMNHRFSVDNVANIPSYTLILSKDDGENCEAPIYSDELESGIKIWSASNNIVIDFNLNQTVNAHVSIYNVLGERIHQEITQANYNRHHVNFSAVTTGVYFVTVEVNGNAITEKIILN